MHSAELLAFAGFGAVILIVAWLPLWLERLPLTLPMLAVGAGYVAFLFTPDLASPQAHPLIATVLLEVVLIVAVMGAGLSIDRRFSWRGWGSAWRLLAIVMPLSIAAPSITFRPGSWSRESSGRGWLNGPGQRSPWG